MESFTERGPEVAFAALREELLQFPYYDLPPDVTPQDLLRHVERDIEFDPNNAQHIGDRLDFLRAYAQNPEGVRPELYGGEAKESQPDRSEIIASIRSSPVFAGEPKDTSFTQLLGAWEAATADPQYENNQHLSTAEERVLREEAARERGAN